MHKISYVLSTSKSVQIPGALVNKLCTVAYDICGWSEWNLLRVTLRATWVLKVVPKLKKKQQLRTQAYVL